MKKYIYFLSLLMFTGLMMPACKKFLTREPLDTPTTGSFLNNEEEMDAALTAVYRSIHWDKGLAPFQQFYDLWSDIGHDRDPGVVTGVFDTYNADVQSLWTNAYITVQRANSLISGMEMGKENVAAETFDRIRAEARTIRAWAYYNLTFLFGDVPLIIKPLAPSEYKMARTSHAEIVDFLLNELEEASVSLPWKSNDRGRIGKGVAIGLKARIALTDGNFQVAAEAANSVITSGAFSLNPRFQDLFTRSGQRVNAGSEIMFEFYRSDNSPTEIRNYVPLGQGSRNLGGQCRKYPNQRLVDMFECTDGKRIDESALYDPADPSKNRDPRLRWTVSIHGDTITHYAAGDLPRTCVFNIYDNTTSVYNYNTGVWSNATNQDRSNAFGPFLNGVGYLWAKYTFNDENMTTARVSWIYMRYAEILLTYAEAKIEMNQIDQTVLDAMNKVRNRGGMPDVDLTLTGNQDKMRQLVRRERTIELALEGFRWFDIRRWKIAELVMPGKITGASIDKNDPAEMPNFKVSSVTDLNDIPDYSASEAKRITRDTRFFTDNQYLLPIPQRERDLNENLSQNDGW